MGLMDKLWDEVFPTSASHDSHHSSHSSTSAGHGSSSAAADAAASKAAAADAPRGKLRSGLSLDTPTLERSESAGGPESSQSPPTSPSPSPLPLSASGSEARKEFGHSRSSGAGRPAASQHISIAGPRRHSLDTARSLPTGLRMPEILSPGSGRNDNVWRSVFHPGNPNRERMEALGASKIDKADPNGPSVYDWFYRKDCRPQYR